MLEGETVGEGLVVVGGGGELETGAGAGAGVGASGEGEMPQNSYRASLRDFEKWGRVWARPGSPRRC